MCRVLYLASDKPLPTIPWDEHQPAFHICPLADCGMGEKVVAQFTKPLIYYVGSYQWCGCGFGDHSEQSRQCLRDLRDFLRAAAAQAGVVEMWSCWTGAEGAEQEEQFIITPDDILDSKFYFGEQEYYLVYPDAERAAAPRAQAEAIMTSAENCLRFAPSTVEGLPGVTEAALFPDRLELLSEGQWVVIRFLDIARWGWRGWLYRPLARLGLGVHGWPAVADRDWFHPLAGRFFRFYTQPEITVYLPDEPQELAYSATLFRRVQDVIRLGGFGTFDLG